MVPVVDDSRAGPRRPRRPLRAVGEHLDRDVLGRRHRLGRCRDEARRDRRCRRRRPARIPTCPACRAATRKSRPRAGWCCRWWSRPAPRRRAETLPRRDRGHRPDRRANARRVAAGARPAAAPDLAAARRRPRSARIAASRRAAVAAQDQGAGAGRCLRSWSCVSTSRSARFIPAKYTRELIDNSDFRKFDDALRMVLDCTPALADEIEQHLADCAAKGIVRYGTHRQGAAMMTCFTPSPTPLQPRAFHRRRDGRLRDGGERAEGQRGLTCAAASAVAFARQTPERTSHEQSHRRSQARRAGHAAAGRQHQLRDREGPALQADPAAGRAGRRPGLVQPRRPARNPVDAVAAAPSTSATSSPRR